MSHPALRLASRLAVLLSVVACLIAGLGALGRLASPGPGEEERLQSASQHQSSGIRRLFAKAGVAYPPEAIALRAFKEERVLELWARASGELRYALVAQYPICALSGGPGPKRRDGDGQVPEGFYFVDELNPVSRYHLSLRLDYPNAADRVLGDARAPGGDIFIHGDCVSSGCIAITDPAVEQLYLIALAARSRAREPIPVHIFPARLTDAALRRLGETHPIQRAFWANLKQGYDSFEERSIPPVVQIDPATGRYLFSE
ncbi:MAG: L,D-transpeptidase family protein [Deltaproteobacteria bacterium]|nr:L,D-transpeptidase family protein [Deltaproteobacteria bacterium]